MRAFDAKDGDLGVALCDTIQIDRVGLG